MISEKEIEYKITEKLKELGWKFDISNNKNVYFQKGREVENKKLGRLRPDFILYSSKRPIAIIEAKKPKENLKKAMIQAEKYAKLIDVNLIFAYDGYNFRTKNLKFNEELYYGETPITEFINEKLMHKFINKWKIDFNFGKKIKNEKDFINKIKNIENLLRKEGLKQGDERFTEFAKILFLKMISQQKDKEYIWEKIKDQINNDTNTIETINQALYNLNNEYNMGKYGNKLNIESLEIVNLIVEKLSEIDFVNTSLDVKGSAFEFFLNYKGKNDDLAQYFTPREITRFLIELSNPKPGELIYDPFCGSGGILIKAYDYIKNQIINDDKKIKYLKEKQLNGTDISTIAYVSKMNMILVGAGHKNIIQQKQGSLWNKRTNKYDVVITNIPFNLPVGEEKGMYDVYTNDGNSISVQHCLDSLIKKEGSRAIIIVPEKFIFSSDAKTTREKILKNYNVKVFSLPQGIFLPYAIAKSSILELTWTNKIGNFEYIDIKKVGFIPNKSKLKIKENDMSAFIENEENFKKVKVTYKELSDNNFIFKPTNKIKKGVKLGDIFKYSSQKADIEKQKRYFEITVRNHGLGAIRRVYNKEYNIKEKYGSSFDNRNIIKDEVFIYSILDARNGGFAKINKDLIGGLYTNTYKCFKLKNEYKNLNLNYISKLLSTPKFKQHFTSLSNGTTNRRSIKKEQFLETSLGIMKDELLKNSKLYDDLETSKAIHTDKIKEYEKRQKLIYFY